MFLKLLGSAAAEGWPAIFCDCEPCRKARELGGKNLRRRTSYQLGDGIHVDFGPDSYGAALEYGLDYSRLRHLFITHSHADHWLPAELRLRREGYGYNVFSPMIVHGNEKVGRELAETGEDYEGIRLQFHEIKPFERLDLGQEWSAIGLPASHATGEQALNYLFTYKGRNVVIGNDTGWWIPEVWDFLQTMKLHLVIMDTTAGPNGPGPGDEEPSWIGSHHLNCKWVVEVRDELQRRGALADDHVFMANHFSHNAGWTHEQFEDFFVPKGIIVGYDGLTLPL
jgi:phosphoribosyl 1,2-cyclic phosphate phosphodiesterase